MGDIVMIITKDSHLTTQEAGAQIARLGPVWTDSLGQHVTLSYGFLDEDPMGTFNTQEIATTNEVLALWSDVANITFVPTSGSATDDYVSRGTSHTTFFDYTNETG